MDINVLQNLAVKEVEDFLASDGSEEQQKLERRKTQKKVIDRVRKNLWTLTCQADVVEMTGELSDFGGEQDVEGSIARAIFGLMCFGAIHGVQISQGIEKLASELRAKYNIPSPAADEAPQADKAEEKVKKKTTSGTLSEEATYAKGSEEQKTGESVAAETDKTAPATSGSASPVDGETSSSVNVSKEEKVKLHEKNLRGAKSVTDLDRVWTQNVTTDKALVGIDKASLYQVYKECRKSLGPAK